MGARDTEDVQKLKRLLPHWLGHNSQHLLDYQKWIKKAESAGLTRTARELDRAVELSREANRYIERAGRLVEEEDSASPAPKPGGQPEKPRSEGPQEAEARKEYPLHPIGVIRTPYVDNAPYQPVADDQGEFRICLDPAYAEGLRDLDRFRYIYVIYLVHKVTRKVSMTVSPYWAPGTSVGVFASRSPVRPNRLGISIVRLGRVEGNVIFTSGLDVFDGTPLLDLKPYIKDLDTKADANFGWLEDLEDQDHLMLHIKGIPHDY